MRVTLGLLLLAGCGGDSSTSFDAPPGGGPDGPVISADADPGAPDAAPPDGAIATCGDGVLPTGDVTGTEGIAIGPDGTLYYSQSGAVGRVTPGGAAEDGWAALGGGTVWGMAVSPAGNMLYVASPSTQTIFQVDTSTGAVDPLYENAGNPNGLVIGPDGAVYYTHFAAMGRVYRVAPASGTRSEVTAQAIPGANGLYFASPTELYVLAYQAGDVYRLTLDASGVESAREVVASLDGALDGIGRDAEGRWYVTDNGGGRLLRVAADWSNDADPEVLLTGIGAAANVAWGKGALDCNDVYVASAGSLGRHAAGVPGNP